MRQYQYQLAKRGKWVCPECGRKTFVCYVDTNGNILDEGVGKCDRADKCAYHYTPRQYFADNEGVSMPRQTRKQYVSKPQPRPIYINDKVFIEQHGNVFRESVEATYKERNHLITFLNGVFGEKIVKRMIADYYIGTIDHWNGATVFYQVDGGGHVHRGKIMLYNPENGKRVHKCNNTAHSIYGISDKKPQACLFGEHLLAKYPDMFVGIVESEKTAIIASGVVNDCIFLACGGCGNLTIAMCEALRGRNVVLFPDNGKLAEWSAKGRILRHLFKTLSIVDIMERPDTLQRWKLNGGDDIGDLILACNLDPKHIQIELKEL